MDIDIFYVMFERQFIIEVILSGEKCFCILPSYIIGKTSQKERTRSN